MDKKKNIPILVSVHKPGEELVKVCARADEKEEH